MRLARYVTGTWEARNAYIILAGNPENGHFNINWKWSCPVASPALSFLDHKVLLPEYLRVGGFLKYN